MECFPAPRPGKKEESPPQSVKEILAGKCESISYSKYLVVKAIDGVSVMDNNIVEVHCKIVEVCQCNSRITPQ